MQTISLDLSNNPDLKSLVADLDVGAKIELKGSIKSKDDQSVTLTVEEASECKDSAADTDAEPMAEDKKKDAKPEGVIPDEAE